MYIDCFANNACLTRPTLLKKIIEAIYGEKWSPLTRLNNNDQYVSYDIALNKDGPRYVFSE